MQFILPVHIDGNAEYCVEHVRMSVCLYVSCEHIPETGCPNFTKFSAHIAYGGGLLKQSLVLISQHCNTLRVSGLWMMSCFLIMGVMLPQQPHRSLVHGLMPLLHGIGYVLP